MLQLPPPVATPVPTAVPPLKIVTVLFASAVPLKVGVVALVMLSVLLLPVSEAAIRSGVDGALGAVVSIVTDRAPDATLTFPAMSVTFSVAVMLCTPCVRVDVLTDQLPEPSAVALPIWVVPSNSLTVVFAAAVPLKVGLVTLVMLSLLEMPLSEAAMRSGVDGAGAG